MRRQTFGKANETLMDVYSRPFKVKCILLLLLFTCWWRRQCVDTVNIYVALVSYPISDPTPPTQRRKCCFLYIGIGFFFFIFSVFCVSTPWELRLKNHPERKIRARWPSRRLLFDVDQVVPVLISPTLHRSVRLPTPTVAITRGLQKYLQFQYHRRRCKDFPPTWYRPGKRKEKALRAIDAASMSIKFREIKLW